MAPPAFPATSTTTPRSFSVAPPCSPSSLPPHSSANPARAASAPPSATERSWQAPRPPSFPRPLPSSSTVPSTLPPRSTSPRAPPSPRSSLTTSSFQSDEDEQPHGPLPPRLHQNRLPPTTDHDPSRERDRDGRKPVGA